ncbi:bifunctional DNA primase/polymerase [Aeoliella mucimassa]|uniref:DNA primase/polymerase bifunctional N-terminal domain-containing protein n=1 Tax=Aeoliella mucimassa TaxID=2527972 RepID=A0A518APT9_9BACT|nr:hypothetical protein Pan181_29450 [Aeoliella mucimassa]
MRDLTIQEPLPVDIYTTPQESQNAEVVLTSVVEAAQFYANKHGLAVFPRRTGQKAPATPHGCRDATKDSHQINSLFQEEHNLAITTPRELMRGSRQWANADSAKQSLGKLVDGGLGSWEIKPPGQKGGRPTRAFVLTDSCPADTITPFPDIQAVLSTSTPDQHA